MQRIVLILFFVFSLSVFAKESNTDNASGLDLVYNSDRAGKEFYLTFHPGWFENDDNVFVYFLTQSNAEVRLKIPALDYEEVKTAVPNQVNYFLLTAEQAMCYTKSDKEKVKNEQVYEQRAINIQSDAPIICYAFINNKGSQEGYFVYPKINLGKKYIVSSWSSRGVEDDQQHLTSYTSIVAAYDNTKVVFKMGGSKGSYIPGTTAIKNDSTRERVLQKGDVWSLGAAGDYADLTGSMVTADKPVAVISGSFCAIISKSYASCDYLIEQDMPVKYWGNEYHAGKFIDRKKASYVNILAFENDTEIRKNGAQWTKVNSNSASDIGFVRRRLVPEEFEPENIVISSDNKISVVQYNTSYNEDKILTDPFQMQLMPVSQYVNETVFFTPSFESKVGGANKLFANVYFYSEDGNVPEDMEIGELVGANYVWKKFANVATKIERFRNSSVSDNYDWYSTTIILKDRNRSFAMRGSNPFMVYSYGYDYYSGYGFQNAGAFIDRSIPDVEKPSVSYEMECLGKCRGVAKEEPIDNPELRSNFKSVELLEADSYNYNFIPDLKEEIIPGKLDVIKWELEVIDVAQPAKAKIKFMDVAGNDSTITIEYEPINITIAPEISVWEKKYPNSPKESKDIIIKNNSKSDINIDDVYLLSDKNLDNVPFSGFYVQENLELPKILKAGEEFKVVITFDPASVKDILETGNINLSDSIYVKAKNCFDKGLAEVKLSPSDIYKPYVQLMESGCVGDFSGTVKDRPVDNEAIRTNLKLIRLDGSNSNNYRLEYATFQPGEDKEISWQITKENENYDAKATIIFKDMAGNDTTVVIEHKVPKLAANKNKLTWNGFEIDSELENQNIVCKNIGTGIVKIDSILLSNEIRKDKGEQGFEIILEETLPLTLSPNEQINIIVKFNPDIVKDKVLKGEFHFTDEIIVKANKEKNGDNYCYNERLVLLDANKQTSPCILAEDINLEETKIGNLSRGISFIKNKGSADLQIFSLSSTLSKYNKQLVLLSIGSEEIDDEGNIISGKTITVPGGDSAKVEVEFKPEDAGIFSAEIELFHNVDSENSTCEEYDNIIEINGKAIKDSKVEEVIVASTILNISPNPVVSDAQVNFNITKPGYGFAELINSKGQVIKKTAQKYYNIGEHRLEMSCNSFSSGVYYIRIKLETEELMQKIIIQK
jgi:hypothetical protein